MPKYIIWNAGTTGITKYEDLVKKETEANTGYSSEISTDNIEQLLTSIYNETDVDLKYHLISTEEDYIGSIYPLEGRSIINAVVENIAYQISLRPSAANPNEHILDVLDSSTNIVPAYVIDRISKMLVAQGHTIAGCTMSPKKEDVVLESPVRKIINSVLDKQARYTSNGKDLIDRWEERYSIEDFRKIMLAVKERYEVRLGEKDDPVQELTKSLDYILRMIGAEIRYKATNG